MKKKHLIPLALVWALLAVLLLSTATYAWFTFFSSTNVDTLEGKMTEGRTEETTTTVYKQLPDEMNLQISSDNEAFSTTATLTVNAALESLAPVSTADLDHFFRATAHNAGGISNAFTDVTDEVDMLTLHGMVYLRCLAENGRIYIDTENTVADGDAQALAAARLGLKITVAGETRSYIFRLDNMEDITDAVRRETVEQADTVVKELQGGQTAVFAEDPSGYLTDYATAESAICEIPADQVATVEYWLYLEGCDEHCNNAVMSREIGIRLAFTGEPF